MILAFCIHIPLLIAICWVLKRKYADNPLSEFFWHVVILKFLAGICIGLLNILIYTSYEGDTWTYHKYAEAFTELLKSNPTEYFKGLFLNEVHEPFLNAKEQPRFFFLVKIISILNIFTFSNYWINSLYFSLFCFFGLWALGIKLTNYFNIAISSILFSFFLFPSFTFWTSGLLKESIAIGIIGCLSSLYLDFQFGKKISLSRLMTFCILGWVGCELKYQYIAILILCMTSYTITSWIEKMIKPPQKKYKTIIYLSVFFSLTITSLLIIPTTLLNYFTEIIFISYENTLKATTSHNYFTFPSLQPSISSYLENSPKALLIGLFRPYPWEVHGLLPVINASENVLIYVLFIFSLTQKLKSKKFFITVEAMTVWTYVFVTAILMAFIAPAWGTLSRYKAGYIFFFLLLISEQNPLIDYTFNKLRFLKKK